MDEKLPGWDTWTTLWQWGVASAEVNAATWASPATLAALRAQRLARLLQAARRSALYAKLLGDADVAGVALQSLPVMRKAQLMRRFDAWVTDPALTLERLHRFVADRSCIGAPLLGRYAVWESSGSSGKPGLFVQDERALAIYDALEAWRRPLLRPWHRLQDTGEKTAFVGAVNGHFASVVSIERLRRLNPLLSEVLRSISFLQPVDRMVAELLAWQPSVLATYPSAAVLLAEEKAAGRLPLTLREVWTGGEPLSAAMRRFISESFGCPVISSYGASEFMALACECHCGSLHLNSDWAILEPVDAHDQPVPDGQAGATTLLTNLANHVQPVIRYDLGDRVAIHPGGACPCGSARPVLQVEGRCDDVLLVGVPAGRQVRLLPLALSTVLEEEAGLFDFQLVQRGPCELMLRTGLEGAAGQAALRRGVVALAGFLAQQGALHVRVHGDGHPPQRAGRSGKVKRVVALAERGGSHGPGAPAGRKAAWA